LNIVHFSLTPVSEKNSMRNDFKPFIIDGCIFFIPLKRRTNQKENFFKIKYG
jgi:hypothetical protein